jgi:hypothetical protein
MLCKLQPVAHNDAQFFRGKFTFTFDNELSPAKHLSRSDNLISISYPQFGHVIHYVAVALYVQAPIGKL